MRPPACALLLVCGQGAHAGGSHPGRRLPVSCAPRRTSAFSSRSQTSICTTCTLCNTIARLSPPDSQSLLHHWHLHTFSHHLHLRCADDLEDDELRPRRRRRLEEAQAGEDEPEVWTLAVLFHSVIIGRAFCYGSSLVAPQGFVCQGGVGGGALAGLPIDSCTGQQPGNAAQPGWCAVLLLGATEYMILILSVLSSSPPVRWRSTWARRTARNGCCRVM